VTKPLKPTAHTRFQAFLVPIFGGQLRRNGLFALGQSVFVAICMFSAFRIVVAHAGLERFGVWSLLLAGAAFVRIGDVSGAGALARFMAMPTFAGDSKRTRELVHTVVLTSLGLNGILGLILLIGASVAMPMFVTPQYIAEATALLPWVMATMVVASLALAVTSGIDGVQRADQRAIVVVFAAVVFLVSTWLLVPEYGVIGFGIAQLAQQVVILVFGWIVLRRHVASLGWLPFCWRYNAFIETTGFAVKLNAIGVAGLLFEPLAKFAFNYTGGPSLVAIYELASRIASQVRGMVTSAAMPLIPAFAASPSAEDPVFKRTLEKSISLTSICSVGIAVISLAGAPFVSVFVLDRLSPEMLIMNAALTAGWAINTVAIPFYFAAQGQGKLFWNFAGHAVISLSVLVGIIFAAPLFGFYGLAITIALGLAMSSPVVILGNAYVLDARKIVWATNVWILSSVATIVVMCGASAVITIRYLVS
jgi:O-antigen/teichoic acid export membrane protein